MDPHSPPAETQRQRLSGARPVQPGDPDLDDEWRWLEAEDLEVHDDEEPELDAIPEDEEDQAGATPGGELALPPGWEREHQLRSSRHVRDMAKDRDRHMKMQYEATLGRRDLWNQEVRSDLFTYAYQVLPAKIITGAVFRMMAAVNGPRAADLSLPIFGPPMTPEEAQDLATDTVTKAIDKFHDVLVAKWDPTKETTFRTFFIGNCCHSFAAVYRMWLRRRKRSGHDGLDDLDEALVPKARDKPHTAAIIRLELDHYFEGAGSDQDRIIAYADALEFPNWLTAQLAGCSEKTVESRLKKFRRLATAGDLDPAALGHLLEGADDLRGNRSRVA